MKGIGVSLLLTLSAVTLPGSSHMQFQWTEGARRLEVTARGAVEFADDDRDVKSLSPDGYFRIEENYLLLFSGRRYEVTADSTGRLTHTYFDHDRAKRLDSQGQAWLMGIMPEVIRKTGLGAVPRLQRILKKGGPSAVLSEISRIRDDEPKRIYLQEFITRANLNPDQLSSAMLQARKIGSDEEKAGLLEAVAPYFLKDNLREAIFQAAGTIGSDEEHSHALLELIKRDAGTVALRLAAKSAGHIGSDEEKAKVLVDIAGRYKGDREVGRSLLSSAGTIGSDEERRHVLSAVLTNGGSDREIPVEALRLAAGIGSDEEKAAVLLQAAPLFADADMARRPFFDAAGTIGSDEQRRHVLSAVLKRSGLSGATLAAVATCAKAMGSDEEKAGVLAEMATGSLQSPAARAAFFEAVNTIGSDDERKRVLLAVARHAGNGAETAIEMAKSAKAMGPDEDKAAVLVELAGSSFQEERLRDAFFTAVDSIGSDDERGKVLSAVLIRRGVSKDVVIRVIGSAAKIPSDEIKTRVLAQAIGASLVDPQVRTAFQKALESIQSDGEYRRLMSAMSKSGAEAR
jgi:hypothetical protein